MQAVKKLSVITLLMIGIILLCSCVQKVKQAGSMSQIAAAAASMADSMAASQYAEEEMESELTQDVKAGELNGFDRIWAVPLDMNNGTFRSVIGYRVHFGGNKSASGLQTDIRCTVTMKKKRDGSYTEVREDRSYEVLGDGEFDNFSWIGAHPYVAQAAKADVRGKSRDEIALTLFCWWMDSLKDWNTSDRTFVVTKYDKPEVKLFTATDTEDWGNKEGRNGTRPIHPGSVKSWIYTCQCRYQFLGYTANVSLPTGYSGKALGVEPYWVEDFAPGGSGRVFVLTEWPDGYTLETRHHCLDAIGN